MRPDQLAGLRVERDNRPARPAGRVEDAFHHQRRALQLVLGERAEAVGLEPPRHFELVEVGAVDLVQRRVAGAFQVGGIMRPLAVLRRRQAGLPRDPRREPDESQGQQRK